MPMDGGRALWETRLAAPLVAEPAVDDEHGKITAVTSAGGIFLQVLFCPAAMPMDGQVIA